MAFCNNKQELVRKDVVMYAEEVLYAYLDGREKSYAVQDVINELSAIFHGAAVIPIQLIHLCMESDDEWQRVKYATQALDTISKIVRGDGV